MKGFTSFEERLVKSEFHKTFISETNMKGVKSNTLTKWLKKWCEFNDYKYEDSVYNSVRYFEIIKVSTKLLY